MSACTRRKVAMRSVTALSVLLSSGALALAQEDRAGLPDVAGPPGPARLARQAERDSDRDARLARLRSSVYLRNGGGSFTKTILCTGYWPPTNEMLRQFSPDPAQNPGGWVGRNWEGRGYDVLAFFPEFPGGPGKGEGDFEVDYQDTSNDWWPLVNQLRPVAIITFSRANTSRGWELEGGNRNHAADWSNDYLDPFKPTPELPSFSEPAGNERLSSLPIQRILAAVTASGANVDPFSTVLDEGRFLSNYIGYHGNWYHDLHADPNDPSLNVAAGHIHVGRFTSIPDGVLATEVTLRALIEYLDEQLPLAGDVDGDGDVDIHDLTNVLADFGCTGGGCPGDADGDGDTDVNDLTILLANFGAL